MGRGWFTWTNFFLRVDGFFKFLERWRLTPLRRRAIRKAVEWMRAHYVDSDGLGAIFPPMIYNVIALSCLGVPDLAKVLHKHLQNVGETFDDEFVAECEAGLVWPENMAERLKGERPV